MKHIVPTTLALTILLTAAVPAGAHCQIPCGIYNDMMRIIMMQEHVTTIEKSMKLIGELSGSSDAADANQLVRWVNNKEQHADELSEIATEYFLKQRIKKPKTNNKADAAKYARQLEILHGILVNTMKAKQKVDPQVATDLGALIDELAKSYFSEEDLKHLESHK